MGDMDDKAEDGEKCRNGQNEKECESNFTVGLPFLLQKRNTDPADDNVEHRAQGARSVSQQATEDQAHRVERGIDEKNEREIESEKEKCGK